VTAASLDRLRLLPLALVLGTGAGPAVLVVANDPSLVRVATAVLILAALGVATVRWPQAAVLLTLSFLPFLALIRRLLIPIAGWTSWDALLIVGPVASLLLLGRLFFAEQRALLPDRLSKLVGVMLLATIAESVNPTGGSIAAGLTGLLFAGAPLAWFFIGRELGDRRLLSTILAITAVSACAIAVYGLWQTTQGLPSWDAAWQNITGYTALDVAGSIRAFGSFASSSEYGIFLGIGFVIAVAAAVRGRLIAVLALPLLGYAILLESARGVVVLALLAIFVLLGLRTGRASVALITTSIAATVAAGVIIGFGPQLTQSAAQSGNPFLAHQAGGLLNPLDPHQSTLAVHQQLALGGITGSVSHPLGQGLAAINPQGKRLSGGNAGTEADFSNEFVALGPLGGVLYFVIILMCLYHAGQLALRRKNAVALAVMGALIASFAQWLNGGLYAVAPLIWFLIGWATQESTSPAAAWSELSAAPQQPANLKWPAPAIGWQ
jgi:hypothetical protein